MGQECRVVRLLVLKLWGFEAEGLLRVGVARNLAALSSCVIWCLQVSQVGGAQGVQKGLGFRGFGFRGFGFGV